METKHTSTSRYTLGEEGKGINLVLGDQVHNLNDTTSFNLIQHNRQEMTNILLERKQKK